MPITAGLKPWAVAHPLPFCAISTIGWYALLLTGSASVAMLVPIAAIWIIGWWRETGLRWQWSSGRQWLLVLAPLTAGAGQIILVRHEPLGTVLYPGISTVAAVVSVEVAGRGLGQFAVRRFGPWRVSAGLAALYGGADLLIVPADGVIWIELVVAIAAGFCLTALRWRLSTVWPLVPLHWVVLHADAGPWGLLFAAGLAGYGCWVLRGYPLVHMADRPTVRVLCFDDRDRVLLVCWRDPSDGSLAWDTPGGGIESGETPLYAARRELREETGLPEDCVSDRYVFARRDAHWNCARFVGVEPYYLARVHGAPRLSRDSLEPHEVRLIREFRWVAPSLATSLVGRVQLNTLADVAERLRNGSNRATDENR